MKDLKGKTLLLLESGILAKDIIDKAHELGVSVIVANFFDLDMAPAKAFADKAIKINFKDIPVMMQLIKDEHVDGIFTAYTDSDLPIYEQLCREAGLPCFAREDNVEIMLNKAEFKKYCRKAGLPVIDEWDANKLLNDENYCHTLEYPIIVKPVDNSGARGISICHDESNLVTAIERGLDNSRSKKVVVEKYLRGTYCLADFMIQNGKVYYCDSCDKPANEDDKNNVNLPGAYIYPSLQDELIKNTLLEGVQKFIDIIQHKNGSLCFELIYSGGKIHIIEAQFRFGAKYQEVFLNKEYGFDQLALLLQHALTGDITDYNLDSKITHKFTKTYALMNILLRKGKVSSVQNPDEVLKMPHVDKYIPMKQVGDVISPDGSMVQCFGKVAMSAGNRAELISAMKYFQSHLQILDENEENMVIPSIDESLRNITSTIN